MAVLRVPGCPRSPGTQTFQVAQAALLLLFLSFSYISYQVVVDHKIEYLSRVCDRIDVLQTGRLIASGAPDQVFNDPVVVDAYLGV